MTLISGNEFAWVIEDTSLANLQYWTGRGADGWSFDHADAMRFSRKEDAERALGWIVPARHYTRVAEHGWMTPNVKVTGLAPEKGDRHDDDR